jgi:hypothetical protein
MSRLAIDRNQVFKFLHDLSHRGSFRGVMSPHAFNEIDNFWAVLFP